MRGISCPARGERAERRLCGMCVRCRTGQLLRRSHARCKLRGRHWAWWRARRDADCCREATQLRRLPGASRFGSKLAFISGNFRHPRARRDALRCTPLAIGVRCRAKAETILERIHRSFVAHGGRDVEIDPQMATISTHFSGAHFPTEHRTFAPLLSMRRSCAQPRTCLLSHSRLAHIVCTCAVRVRSAMPARTAMGSTRVP